MPVDSSLVGKVLAMAFYAARDTQTTACSTPAGRTRCPSAVAGTLSSCEENVATATLLTETVCQPEQGIVVQQAPSLDGLLRRNQAGCSCFTRFVLEY